MELYLLFFMNTDVLHMDNFTLLFREQLSKIRTMLVSIYFVWHSWLGNVGKNHADIYWISWALLNTYVLIHISSAEFGIEPVWQTKKDMPTILG